MGRLRIGVAELLGSPGEQRRITGSYSLDDLRLSTSWIESAAEVDLDLMLEAVFGGLTVTGRLGAPWVGECRRCLQPARGRLDVALQEVFAQDPDDDDRWPIDGDVVDLEPAVREALLLALPVAPLCTADCAGPAPGDYPTDAVDRVDAGEDRGGDGSRDPRWAALDDLELPEE